MLHTRKFQFILLCFCLLLQFLFISCSKWLNILLPPFSSFARLNILLVPNKKQTPARVYLLYSFQSRVRYSKVDIDIYNIFNKPGVWLKCVFSRFKKIEGVVTLIIDCEHGIRIQSSSQASEQSIQPKGSDVSVGMYFFRSFLVIMFPVNNIKYEPIQALYF